jgi:hypothetical protein
MHNFLIAFITAIFSLTKVSARDHGSAAVCGQRALAEESAPL